ncbi:hypothetical protein CYMTET_36613 [Cymbomonas tetramitiformis]|uniref:F-box domain-containing protein n=1 Tax=Cymbomonas tetramitiformis TaxID=36881 RepID=A0AAE0CHC7_9CHLO|nr:hypothetical protein CYMTET_36613 [Cymbomonas tetramitiformis]
MDLEDAVALPHVLELLGIRELVCSTLSCADLFCLSQTCKSLQNCLRDVEELTRWACSKGRQLQLYSRAHSSCELSLSLCQRVRDAIREVSDHGDLQFSCGIATPSVTLCEAHTRAFCWPLVSQLCLKPEYFSFLHGTHQPEYGTPTICEEDIALVLGIKATLWAEAATGWLHIGDELNTTMRTQAVLLSTTGQFIYLEHHLISLDNCRGSSDSPGGMEQRVTGLVSPTISDLTKCVSENYPRLLPILFDLGLRNLPPAAPQRNAKQLYCLGTSTEGIAWQGCKADRWESLMCTEPITDQISAFLGERGVSLNRSPVAQRSWPLAA